MLRTKTSVSDNLISDALTSLVHVMQTVPRIRSNRNRAVFQLSFVPEFYDFVAHRKAARNVFQYLLQSDVLDLSRRFSENTLVFAD
jgi:hypothetical protein